MKQFISNLMRDKEASALNNALSEDDTPLGLKEQVGFDEGASNVEPTSAEKRNEAIFRNLTFD